jgi:hypothetical protein
MYGASPDQYIKSKKVLMAGRHSYEGAPERNFLWKQQQEKIAEK